MVIHKLKSLDEISNSEIKGIMSYLCEDSETYETTPKGKKKTDKDGDEKPPIKSVELKNSSLSNCHIYFFEKYDDNSLSCIQFDIDAVVAEQILIKYKLNFEKSIIPHDYNIISFDIEGQLAGKSSMMKLPESEVYNLEVVKNKISDANHSSESINYGKLDFYVVSICDGTSELLFFEKYEPSMRLDKTRLLKAIVSRQQKKFNKVIETQDHFYLKFNMSCFSFNSEMYILKKPIFEKIFDYEVKYKEICSSSKNTDFMNELNLFDDMQVFSEKLDTDNLNVLRKFSHLMDFQKEIQTLVADIREVERLIVDYKVKGIVIENKKINVQKSNFQSILKFLDRGQTEHRITKEKFESDHKTRVN
jgi:hypothetical protein